MGYIYNKNNRLYYEVTESDVVLGVNGVQGDFNQASSFVDRFGKLGAQEVLLNDPPAEEIVEILKTQNVRFMFLGGHGLPGLPDGMLCDGNYIYAASTPNPPKEMINLRDVLATRPSIVLSAVHSRYSDDHRDALSWQYEIRQDTPDGIWQEIAHECLENDVEKNCCAPNNCICTWAGGWGQAPWHYFFDLLALGLNIHRSAYYAGLKAGHDDSNFHCYRCFGFSNLRICGEDSTPW